MAKSGNPFLDFDFTQMMDPAKLLEQYRMPGFDSQQAMDVQRKNMEAIAAANRIVYEGAQAVAKRQAEILQQVMGEASGMMKELSDAAGPEERLSRQAEITQRAFEEAVANMRELAELSAKAQTEAIERINERVSESLAEIRGLLDEPTKQDKSKKK